MHHWAPSLRAASASHTSRRAAFPECIGYQWPRVYSHCDFHRRLHASHSPALCTRTCKHGPTILSYEYFCGGHHNASDNQRIGKETNLTLISSYNSDRLLALECGFDLHLRPQPWAVSLSPLSASLFELRGSKALPMDSQAAEAPGAFRRDQV